MPIHTRGMAALDAMGTHPRLEALIERAQEAATDPRPLALVYPADALAFDAACRIAQLRVARPLLVGPANVIHRAAAAANVDASQFEIIDTPDHPIEAARRAAELASGGDVFALMKGTLHTDQLMTAVVDRASGLRGTTRISHACLFDLPRYPKLLGLADCAINIAPTLDTKREILTNAIGMLNALGLEYPKVAVISAVETVNPAIPATMDAQALVELSHRGLWPGAQVEGPFALDNAISAHASRIKNIRSEICGDVDLLLMPDLNAGNVLYKSLTCLAGGDCAGLVLGARVPIVITSRADSMLSRVASVALAMLSSASGAQG